MKAYFLFRMVLIQHFIFQQSTGTGQYNLLVEQPAFIEVEAGESVTINCTFKAKSTRYFVRWSLGCSNYIPFYSESGYRHRVTLHHNQITIFNLTENDSGTYCCHVVVMPGGDKGTGNGTRIVVTQRRRQNQTEPDGTDTRQFILYTIIGLEFCIIIALLVFITKNRLQGSRDTHAVAEEQNLEPTLHYAEIAISKVPSRPRSKHTEETITYQTVKMQH